MKNEDTILQGGVISDWLLDNHKSLQRRIDFEDLCESLDEIQHEEHSLGYQLGFQNGSNYGFEKCIRLILLKGGDTTKIDLNEWLLGFGEGENND